MTNEEIVSDLTKEEVISQLAHVNAETNRIEAVNPNYGENPILRIQVNSLVEYGEVLKNKLDKIAEEERIRLNPPIQQPQPIMLSVDNDPNVVTNALIEKLRPMRDSLDKWIEAHGNNCRSYNLQSQPNSSHRVYFNYGYVTAFEDVLKMLGVEL